MAASSSSSSSSAPAASSSTQAAFSLATDCSGMETPVMALKRLGIEVDHLFACDVDKHAKATIMANFPPKQWYDDLTVRCNEEAPKADVYIAGFPCQPFSMAGLKGGFDDKRGRGNIFFRVRDYIHVAQPKVFILENVSGLVSIDGGQYFKAICQSLEDLGTYNIVHKILNTQDHGVPQNRKRIYFLGLRKDVDQGNFEWPENLPKRPIGEFLDPAEGPVHCRMLPPKSSGTAHANVKTAIKELQSKGHDPFEEDWIVDCDSSSYRFKWVKDYTPCLTCSRAAGHWITSRGRRQNLNEMLRLQGMMTLEEGFKKVVTDRQLGKQIGNAMSCNILERLFVRLLPAVGLAPQGTLVDRWAVKAGLPGVMVPAASSSTSFEEPTTPKRLARGSRATVPSSLVTPERRRSKAQTDSMITPPTKRRRSSALEDFDEDDVLIRSMTHGRGCMSTGRKSIATPASKPPAARRLRATTTEEELAMRPMPPISLEDLFEQRRIAITEESGAPQNRRRGNVEARRLSSQSVVTINSSQPRSTELLSQSQSTTFSIPSQSQRTLLLSQSLSESQELGFASPAPTQRDSLSQASSDVPRQEGCRTPPRRWACSLARASEHSTEKQRPQAGRFGAFLRDSRGRFTANPGTQPPVA